MSNDNHRQVPQSDDSRLAKLETALRIATVIAEANERLFKVQSATAAALLEEHAKQLKALLHAKDSSAPPAEWAGRYQANVRRILDVTRACFEIVPHTQAEMAKLVGAPFAPYGVETQEQMDMFTKAVVDGSDAAAAVVKDLLAKAGPREVRSMTARKRETV